MKRKQKEKLGAVRAFDPTPTALKIARPVSWALSVTALIVGANTEARVLWNVAALLLASWEIVWGTLQEILFKKLHRGQLILLLAGIIVFCTGHMIESTVAMLIASFGFWVREMVRATARADMDYFDSLLTLRARLRQNGKNTFVRADSLAVGQTVEVFSGDTVPADGVVLDGSGSVDYSGWLHRSRNVALGEGVTVYCGAINYGQPFLMRVSAAGKNTLAQKMRLAAAKSLDNKATVQTVLRKLTYPIGALMALIAMIVGLFVPLFGGESWGAALYRAANVIALAGIGEIVVSVSLAFATGISALCRRGVLFKSCRQVMLLNRITDLIFSKTGTLTDREFLVYEIVPHNDYNKDDLLYYAAAAEQVSDHLIADAILKKAGNITLPEPEHVLKIAGEGVCAYVDGKRVFVGNDMLMRRAGITVLPYHGNGIVCFVALEDTYIGCIVLNDPLKPGAADAIDGLFNLGIRSIDLVTGDKRQNGESVAYALGLHRVFAELTEKQKVESVEQSARKSRRGGRIAFIGDESDIDCMKVADLSFALKTVESMGDGTGADIAVLSDHPDGVLDSFILCQRIRKVVFTMLYLSAGVKLVMLILSLSLPFMPFWCVVTSEILLSITGALLAHRCRKYK